MTFNEQLAETLAEQSVGVDFHPAGTGCCGIAYNEEYQLHIMGWNMQSFGTKEGAEKCRLKFKEKMKETILKILANIEI
jgi:hypothetical protein